MEELRERISRLEMAIYCEEMADFTNWEWLREAEKRLAIMKAELENCHD